MYLHLKTSGTHGKAIWEKGGWVGKQILPPQKCSGNESRVIQSDGDAKTQPILLLVKEHDDHQFLRKARLISYSCALHAVRW